jgi:hypothetical protein
MSSRIIVAGGGGGYVSGGGKELVLGYGGGLVGGRAEGLWGGISNTVFGGTQLGGGTVGDAGSGCVGIVGGFGYGAGNTRAGGGGGYYGGGAACLIGSGGSGYVGGVQNYGSKLAQTIGGNLSFPAPGGGTEVGHPGDGYARITPINQPAVISIGGSACTNVVITSDTSLTCQTTAHAAGTVGVTATTEGASGSLGSGYSYVAPPVISSIEPNTGLLTTGGQVLTIAGIGFQSNFTVTVGGVACASKSYTSSTSVSCTTPVMTAGTRNVVVTTDYGTSNAVGIGFVEPSLSLTVSLGAVGFSASPNGGTSAGYTVATVGTNNPRGYKLSLESAGSDLVCGSHTIPSVAGDGALSIAAGKHGAWGWNVVPPGGTWTLGEPDQPNTWRIVPVGTPTVMADTNVPVPAGESYGVYFGAMVDSGQAACGGYLQSLTVSAVVNP